VEFGGVAGGDAAVDAGGGVELREQGCHEGAVVLGADPLVDRAVGVRQFQAGAAGVAVRVQGERGQGARADAVADGVEDRDVDDVAVRGVVEGVAADVVAGFEDRGDHGVVGGEGQRRQLVPDDLGGELHGEAAAGALDRVAVEAAAGDQLGDQGGDDVQVAAEALGGLPLQPDLDHAEALGAVQQRQPQAGVLVGGAGCAEGLAGEGAVDLAGLVVAGGAVQGPERHLLVVDHQRGDLLGAEQRGDGGQRRGQVLGAAAPAQVEQAANRLHRVGIPAAVGHGRCVPLQFRRSIGFPWPVTRRHAAMSSRSTPIRPARRSRHRALRRVTLQRMSSATAFSELRGLLADVPGSSGFRYAASDSLGQGMDTAKIVANPAGGFLALYHSLIEGQFHVSVSTSDDLLTWRFHHRFPAGSSQPTLAVLDDGVLVAWEQEPRNHLAFRWFDSVDDLLAGKVSRSFDAPLSLSRRAEGTPSLDHVSGSRVVVGGHYLTWHRADRQLRGVLDGDSWSARKDRGLDRSVSRYGVRGNIGGRDYLRFRGYRFALLEGQRRRFDFGTWRLFLRDCSTGVAVPVSVRTHKGSAAFANPTATVLPGGIVVFTLFLPREGAAPGEAGCLIYFHELR
jgi:hypothetical protein